jgi:peptidoglycan/LPS O-acetylase OafA/YrhL
MIAANERSNDRIGQLDGWRGISILFVVAGHLITRHYNTTHNPEDPSIANVLSVWGVDIFFVISGFIITKLAFQEYNQTGSFSVREFYTRRFFRIIPPFYLYLLSVILVSSFSLIVQPNHETLKAAAFVCNFPNVCSGWFAGHTWTLAYEEQFYLSFPLLFGLVGRNSRKFIAMLFFALVMFPFVRFVLHFGDASRIAASFASGFSFICAGAVSAAYEENIKWLAKSRAAIYLSCCSALFLMGLLFLNATFAFPLGSSLAYMQISLMLTVLPVCIAWLVTSSVHKSNLFTKVLTSPPLLFFGMISYSLYLWQQMFTGPESFYLSSSLLFSTPLLFVIATLSYYFVERPFVQLGKSLLHPSSQSHSFDLTSTKFVPLEFSPPRDTPDKHSRLA